MGCGRGCGCEREYGQPRWVFNRCLCCSLRCAVVIIGILDLVFCLGWVISLSIVMSIIGQTSDGRGRGSILTVLLQFAVHAFVACALLHGARTESRGVLWAYIWARSVELCTDVSRILLLEAVFGYATPYLLFLIPVAALILGLFVVRSYAYQLKAKANLNDPTVEYTPGTEEVQA